MLIDSERLPVHAGCVYVDSFHITAERCQVVKLEDIQNAEEVKLHEHHDATEAAYNHGFTDGFEKGSAYTAPRGWFPITETPQSWRWVLVASRSVCFPEGYIYSATCAAPDVFELMHEEGYDVLAWQYIDEVMG